MKNFIDWSTQWLSWQLSKICKKEQIQPKWIANLLGIIMRGIKTIILRVVHSLLVL